VEFEDAIAVLGKDLGIDLVVEDGVAEFVATSQDGDEPVEVSISAMDDGESAVLSADLGEMPSEGADELMLRMLEANHLFDATGGASLSVEDDRAKLERYVNLVAFQREEGANIVPLFVEMARTWRGIVAGDDERGAGDFESRDAERAFEPLTP
jgi:hypothetical protein